MKKLLCLLTLGLMTLGLSSLAAAGQIMINNGTGFPIYEIYVSDSGTSDWEEDILDVDVLMPGESVRLTVPAYQSFDLKAVDNGGNSAEWYKFPGNVGRITIFADGTAEYQ